MGMDFFERAMKTRIEGVTLKMPKKRDFDINNKSTWHSKCMECGGRMDYADSTINPRYVCKRCGNILEV